MFPRSKSLPLPVALVIGCLLLHLVPGCGDRKLAEARARWETAGIGAYRFDYKLTGFAPRTHVRIVVRDAVVAGLSVLSGPELLTVATAPTIPKLFDIIESREDDADVRVKYDPTLGIPLDAYFDGGQEGDGFEVTNFERLPAEPPPPR